MPTLWLGKGQPSRFRGIRDDGHERDETALPTTVLASASEGYLLSRSFRAAAPEPGGSPPRRL
ncbi:MAG: hypothetical protein HY901_21525 [Deltaproteobacteria bacterium]|nr:hypothetical protein [Deltaproteobacteria bacterium]